MKERKKGEERGKSSARIRRGVTVKVRAAEIVAGSRGAGGGSQGEGERATGIQISKGTRVKGESIGGEMSR